ncbi:MAG: nucleoside deaminase [Bacilli bacterium]|nr:nucleoside deaminase [Bacilli bacterium]
MKNDEFFMKEALKAARKAFNNNEVPVGCVVVKDNEIISRGYNHREHSNTVFSHAEIIALDKACKRLDSWRLDECTVYVTLEPCVMCAGAMIQARVKRLVYAAKEPKFGAHQSILNLFEYPFNHKLEVVSGVLEAESSQLLKAFFQALREQKALNNQENMI